MALDNSILYTNIKTELANNVTMNTYDVNGKAITIHPFGQDGNPKANMVYNSGGISESATGFDIIIKVISEKVIQHITDNIQTTLLDRFEKLETDFDNFVTAMNGVGVGPSTAVPAAVVAFLATSNTVSRLADKTAESLIQKDYLYGNK
jgi:hypothetical protein